MTPESEYFSFGLKLNSEIKFNMLWNYWVADSLSFAGKSWTKELKKRERKEGREKS